MKLVAIDNYDREEVADILIAENVSERDVELLADAWNAHYSGEGAEWWCVVKEDDYCLSKGMEDLV